MNSVLFIAIFGTPIVTLWLLWIQGDNQKFYSSMNWKHPWVTGNNSRSEDLVE